MIEVYEEEKGDENVNLDIEDGEEHEEMEGEEEEETTSRKKKKKMLTGVDITACPLERRLKIYERCLVENGQ